MNTFHDLRTQEGQALLETVQPPVSFFIDEDHCPVLKRKGVMVHFKPHEQGLVVASTPHGLMVRGIFDDDVLVMAINNRPGFIECHFRGCNPVVDMFVSPECIEAEMAV